MLQIQTANPEGEVKVFLQPWHLLLLVLAGQVNRRRQDAMEYLLVENRMLRQKFGRRRILLSDEQRRRLAVKGKILGRKILAQVASIVTPETVLRLPSIRNPELDPSRSAERVPQFRLQPAEIAHLTDVGDNSPYGTVTIREVHLTWLVSFRSMAEAVSLILIK
jgi:hypothetical protein